MKSKLYKHLVNFTDKKGTRPVLSAVHFNNDGNLYATNSHIAIKVNGHNPTRSGMNLIPTSMEQVSSEYPNVSRLFQIEGFNTNLTIAKSDLKGICNFLKVNKKDTVCIKIEANDNKVLMEINGSSHSFTAVALDGGSIEITLSTDYLSTILQTFESEVSSDINVGIESSVRPMVLESEHIQTLISPIRVGG